jgi:hypothetical protein
MRLLSGIVFLTILACGPLAQSSLVLTITQLPNGPITIGTPASFQVSAHSNSGSQTVGALDFTISLSNNAGGGGIFTSGVNSIVGTGGFFNQFPGYSIDYSIAPTNLTLDASETVFGTVTLNTTSPNVVAGNYTVGLNGLDALDAGNNPITFAAPPVLNYTLSFTAVPEPTSMAFISAMVMGSYGIHRLRRRRLPNDEKNSSVSANDETNPATC